MSTPIPAPFLLELSSAHVLALQCGACASRFLDRVAAAPAGPDQRAGLEAVRMAALACRLMEGVERVVPRLRGDLPAACDPAPARPAEPARPKLHAAPGQRRGRLKNGTPPVIT
jgi:hypothetical protein